MKKTSKRKLIAFLCVFALGAANVEKSRVWSLDTNILGKFQFVKPIKDMKPYLKMWEKGLIKIYQQILDLELQDDCEYRVVLSDPLGKAYYFPDCDSQEFANQLKSSFSPANRAHVEKLFDYSASNFDGSNLRQTPLSNFVSAGILRGRYHGKELRTARENEQSQGLFGTAMNSLGSVFPGLGKQNRVVTLGDALKNLDTGDVLVFNDPYHIFSNPKYGRQRSIEARKLPKIETCKYINPDNDVFSNIALHPFKFLTETNPDARNALLLSYLGQRCDGVVLALCKDYNDTDHSFSSMCISKFFSEEINNLKKEVLVKYLEDAIKLNPEFSEREVCKSPILLHPFGEIYFKKASYRSFIDNLKFKIRISPRENGDQKPNFYPATEVAYNIWLETRGLVRRSYENACQSIQDIAGSAGMLVLSYGIWRSSDYFYSLLGRKVLRTGEYTAEFLKSRNKLLNDPMKLKRSVSNMMKEGVVGLRSTIDALTNLVIGKIAMSKIKSVFNKSHCQLITFVGPPGTGKSLLANKFALALTGKPLPSWGYFTSSSIDPEVPVVNQFFNGNSELVKQLKMCGGNTVLFFDEIDKYDSKELLEKFRDAIDSGTMEVTSNERIVEKSISGIEKSYQRVKTEKINISGLIVIFGTNEKPECWGLPSDDPNDIAANTGRTVVERDGSLITRFLKFKFPAFKLQDYEQMYDNALKFVNQDSQKAFGLKLVLEDNLSEKLAEESCCRMQGGRSVAIILNEMAGAITSFDMKEDTEKYEKGIFAKIKRFVKTKKPKVQKVKVKFNNDTHKFEIEQIFDDTIPEVPEENEEDNENEKDQEVNNQEINNSVNSDIPDQHDNQQNEDNQRNEDDKKIDNQEVNNQVINNEVDDNVINKQDEQQEVNDEPVEHQKDESEDREIENDKEFDDKSISDNLSNDQHESDQEEIASYDSDYENDKKPINLEDNREEIIAD